MPITGPTHSHQVEHVAIDRLTSSPQNARTHSKDQIRALARSIERFGFTNPVLIDENRRILAGHGRVQAARRLGLKEVPTLRVDHLSSAEKRAYVIADNRLAEKAGWDRELLAIELGALIELDFPVDLIGFAPAEIELLIENHGEDRGADPGPEDEPLPPDRTAPPLTRLGDVWLLGQHRLLCGDARDTAAYDALLSGETVRAVITDPPYNVKIDGHVSSGRRHREFAMASGELSPAEFTTFLRTAFAAMATVSDPGALAYVFMDWRHLQEALAAGDAVFDGLLNLIVWNKMTAGMGSFYRSQHELGLLFRTTPGQHLNTVELGRHGRNRSNVWSCRGLAGFGEGREEVLSMHPTVKPVAMIADALLDCTRRRDIVLDPFAGSGTMLLAAEKTNRRARVIEIDPAYCDVAIRRWQRFTGKAAVHATSAIGFDDVVHEEAFA